MKSSTKGYTDYGFTGTHLSDSHSDLTKILIGAAAGAALGAIVGAAFTEKGKKTTSRISESTKQLAETIKEKADSAGVTDTLARTFEAVKDTAVDTITKEAQNLTSGLKSNS